MQSGSERDDRVMTILAAALEMARTNRPKAERDAYLKSACEGDESLLQEVGEALEWELRMGNFLQKPVTVLHDSGEPPAKDTPVNLAITCQLVRQVDDTIRINREQAGNPAAAEHRSSPKVDLTNSPMGRFVLETEIGQGGFGRVFRAVDPVINRVVAVKILTATDDAESLSRFKKEAIAAGNLHHTNIITVYEFGQEGKTPYLVMEYLNGQDLQQLINQRVPLSLYQKIRIMDQVADGLYCAHRNGVLHRDIKPANIMVGQDGTVKVMDFGIARLMRDTSTRLTKRGSLMGTAVYMAPELFAEIGVEVDALCDIWSYGVIFYELLAGKNPFEARNMQAVMNRIVQQDPSPLTAEVCPPELQAVIDKLLSKRREDRYQTLEDTRLDLRPIVKSLEETEADRLLSDAERLISLEHWNEVLAAAREARNLDPQNRAARMIFERANKELQRQNVQTRVDELLRRSNQAAEQRKMVEAIELLDSARKIDAGNQKVLGRLRELLLLKVRFEDAAKLVVEAESESRDGNRTPAFEHASKAVHLDPDNPQARRLLESIQSEIHAQAVEEASVIEEALNRKDWPTAREKLDAAAKSFPRENVFSRLRDDLSRRESESLHQLVREGRRLLDAGQVAEAAQFCVVNLRDYRDVPEVGSLVQAIYDEKKRRKMAGEQRG